MRRVANISVRQVLLISLTYEKMAIEMSTRLDMVMLVAASLMHRGLWYRRRSPDGNANASQFPSFAGVSGSVYKSTCWRF